MSTEAGQSPRPENPSTLTDVAKRWSELFVTISTFVAAVLTAFMQEGAARNAAAVVAALAVIAAGVASYRLTKKKNRAAVLERQRVVQEDVDRKNAFRGVFPFDERDRLPGAQRRAEASAIATRVASDDFHFGVVCGDSGAGKTSLLRAEVVRRLSATHPAVEYIRSPQKLSAEAVAGTEPFVDAIIESLRQMTSTDTPPIVILDQFEDVFVAHHDRATRERLGDAIMEALERGARIVIAIRHEYLADVHDLSEKLSRYIAPGNLFRVRNFEAGEAKDVIAECASADGIADSTEVAEMIASDLSENGQVRPPELQIVCTRLVGKFTLDNYRLLGGAAGILSHYVRDAVEIAPRQDVAARVLRLLCDFPARARSKPVTLDAIVDGVATAGSTPELRTTVERILGQLVAAGLVLHERKFAVSLYSLIHDYLVHAVLLATSDASTRTEEANQLLRYHLGINRVIPLDRLRFIRQHADPAMKRDPRAQRLMRRSLLVPAAVAAGVVVAGALVAIGIIAWQRAAIRWDVVHQARHWTGTGSGAAHPVPIHDAVVTAGGDFVRIWDRRTGSLRGTFPGLLLMFASRDSRSASEKEFITIGSSDFGYAYAEERPVEPGTRVETIHAKSLERWNVPLPASGRIQVVTADDGIVGYEEKRSTLGPGVLKVFSARERRLIGTVPAYKAAGRHPLSASGDYVVLNVSPVLGKQELALYGVRRQDVVAPIPMAQFSDAVVVVCASAFTSKSDRLVIACTAYDRPAAVIVMDTSTGAVLMHHSLPANRLDASVGVGVAGDDKTAFVSLLNSVHFIDLNDPSAAPWPYDSSSGTVHSRRYFEFVTRGTDTVLTSFGRPRFRVKGLRMGQKDTLTLSDDETRIAVWRSATGTAELWDVRAGRKIKDLRPAERIANATFIDRNGVVLELESGKFAVYDARTGDVLAPELPAPKPPVLSVNPDCRAVTAWSTNGVVTTWAEGRSILGKFRRSACAT